MWFGLKHEDGGTREVDFSTKLKPVELEMERGIYDNDGFSSSADAAYLVQTTTGFEAMMTKT